MSDEPKVISQRELIEEFRLEMVKVGADVDLSHEIADLTHHTIESAIQTFSLTTNRASNGVAQMQIVVLAARLLSDRFNNISNSAKRLADTLARGEKPDINHICQPMVLGGEM